MFENSQIVDKFLNFWRTSGLQRSGLLFGKYEAYEGVPLGIRAVVSAIYEPPQVN
jgi:nuclear protein localization family protein 4